jgi:hypothetical protein
MKLIFATCCTTSVGVVILLAKTEWFKDKKNNEQQHRGL